MYEDALANKPKAAPAAKKELDAVRKELEERTVRLAQLKQQEAAAQTEIDLINARKKDIETHDREADRRVPAGAIQVGGSQAGHALRVAQLADPGHGQPVPAHPAGPASRSLHQRQLHADSARGPLHDLPRRRGPQGLRGPEDPRGLPVAPADAPHGRQRIHAPRQLVRLHALPRRARPRDVVLVGRPLARERRPEGGLDQEVRLGVRPLQREPGPAPQVRGGRLLPLPREGDELPGGAQARRRDADRRVPGLLGLPPHRRAREAAHPEGRSLARACRREGPARLDDPLGHGPGVLPRQHEDADVLLPRELRGRVGPAKARLPRSRR